MKYSVQFIFFGSKFRINAFQILIGLLFLGFLFRIYNLDYTGLWLDEINSMKGAKPSSTFKEVYEYSKQDQPPFFFLLLNSWLRIFGYTDYIGRAMTCFFGVMGILAMFYLGKEFKDSRLGLISAFLTTINWFHVGISVEIRFYSLVFLLSTLSFLFFVKSLKQQKHINFLLYTLFTSLLLNTHYFGLVLFATQFIIFVFLLIAYESKKSLLIGGFLSGVIVSLSILHWVPVFLHDLQISSFHIKPLTFKFLAKFLWWYVYDPAAFIIYILCGITYLNEVYKNTTKRKIESNDLVLIGWTVIGFLIPLLYSILRMPMFTNKYCVIQLPVLLLMVAIGIHSITSKRILTLVISILFLSGLFILFSARPQYKKSRHEDGREIFQMYFTSDESDIRSWSEDWREIALYFRYNSKEKQVLFSQLDWFHEYYFAKFGLEPPVNHNQVDFKKSLIGKEHVWLLRHNFYKNGNHSVGFLPDQKKIIDNEFYLIDSVEFKQTKAFLFIKRSL